MADTSTANYALTKPEINGSPNTWGNKLNANMDVIDTNMKRIDNLATDAVLRAGSGVDPDKYIRAVLRYQSTVTPSNDLDLANVLLLKTWLTNISPIGSVIMWGGSVASIPLNWSLCDGTIQNGIQTVDLRDRFVVGAGFGYAPGNIGGATAHNHGGLVGYTAITPDQMPSHTHGVNDPGHAHGVFDPGHAHTQRIRNIQSNYGGGPSVSAGTGVENTTTDASGTGVGVYASGTGIYLSYTGGSAGHTHSVATSDHRPPFYALAFIMRTKYPWS